MKLNTLITTGHRYRNWCGPSAAAIITGRTLKYCHNKFAKLRGKEPRYIKGVYNSEMRKVLWDMGYICQSIRFDLIKGKRSKVMPTLSNWINDIQNTEQFRSVVLINVTGHYVVAQKGMVCDNQYPEPMPVIAHGSARKRIVEAWIVRRRK